MGYGIQHLTAGLIITLCIIIGHELEERVPGIWVYFFAVTIGLMFHLAMDKFFW